MSTTPRIAWIGPDDHPALSACPLLAAAPVRCGADGFQSAAGAFASGRCEAVAVLAVGSEALDAITRLRNDHPSMPLIALVRPDDEAAEHEALRHGADECAFVDDLDDALLRLLVRRARARRASIGNWFVTSPGENVAAWLRFVLSRIPAVLWVTDRDLRVSAGFGSPDAGLGWASSLWLGRTLPELFGRDDPGFPPIQAHRRALDGENVTYLTHWQDCTFHARVGPLRDERGEIIGVVGSAVEISDRIRAEQGLRETQLRLAALLEKLPAVVFYETGGGRQFISSNAFHLLGYTAEELTAERHAFTRLIHPDDVEPIRLRYLQWRNEGARHELVMQFRVRRRDDRYVWIEDRMIRIHPGGGGRPYLAGVLTDITAQRQAEESLRESQRALTTLISNLPGVAYRAAPSRPWRLEYVSDGVEELTGYPAREFLERRLMLADLIDPGDLERVWSEMQRCLDAHAPFTIVYRLTDRAGRLKWVWEQARGVYDHQGTLRAVEGFLTDITSRIDTERALRASETRYRRLLHAVRDAVFVYPIEDDGSPARFIEVNDEACRRLGYTRDELLEKTVFDISSTGRRQFESARRQMIEGQPAFLEVVHRTADGELIPVEVSANLVTIEGRPHVITTARDISERKRAEAELRRSEERFRRATLDSPFPVMIHREDGRVVAVNRAWTDITGYRPEELTTIAAWTDRACGDQAPWVRQLISRLYEIEDRIMEGEFEIRTASGATRTWEFWSAPLGRDEGGLRLVISVAADVTARKQAERALQRSEQRYRLAARATRDAIWDWDLDSGRIHWNEAIRDLFGYDVTVTEFQWWLDRIHADDRALVSRTLDQAVQRGDEHWNAEYRFRRADGTYADALDRGWIVRDEHGRPVRMIGAILDLTERKRAELALRESEERYRRLAASRQMLLDELNHRVKNNLSNLISLVSIIEERSPDPAAFARSVRQRLLGMNAVHEIITTSEWADMTLDALLRRLTGHFTSALDLSGKITVDGPAAPVGPQQATPLAMVLHELITNSLKHGALRTHAGAVRLTWTRGPTEGDVTPVQLQWIELNGPAARAPEHYGLGLRLIEGFSRFDLGGRCGFEFGPEGFRCRIDCRLEIHNGPPSDPSNNGGDGRQPSPPHRPIPDLEVRGA